MRKRIINSIWSLLIRQGGGERCGKRGVQYQEHMRMRSVRQREGEMVLWRGIEREPLRGECKSAAGERRVDGAIIAE